MPLPRIRLADLVRQASPAGRPRTAAGSTGTVLREVAEFGANPGQLRLLCHIPEGLPVNAPLVVVLHGCQQDAEGFVHGTGWAELADRHGFAVLAPAQQRQNNANNCFNWFEPLDQARDGGEAASIAGMVRCLVAEHRLDPRRVFVTGLSAGGAMATAMLATYPELFAGGAIVAGLPYGVAGSVPEAFAAMHGGGSRSAAELARLVRTASGHRGPWPRVAIWQGGADSTVVPANADALVAQWSALHDIESPPSTRQGGARHRTTTWQGRDGSVAIERHDIAGLGHGVPIDAARCGEAVPFILDVGVSSSEAIAAFFGVAPPIPVRAGVIAVGRDGVARGGASHRTPTPEPRADGASAKGGVGAFVEDTIRRALAAAGLAKP